MEMSARERFLARIVQPDAFFILLIAGALGLYIEFTHPGMIAPGVIGAIALVLALFAMHILPVNFAGLLLIVVALGLFILEAKYTSHGVLAAGGIIAMLLGAFMLIRSPITGAGVSFGVALGMTVPCALVTIFLMRLVLRSRSWKQSTGAEQLLGEQAEVTEADRARGSRGDACDVSRHGALARRVVARGGASGYSGGSAGSRRERYGADGARHAGGIRGALMETGRMGKHRFRFRGCGRRRRWTSAIPARLLP